ncbi:MAG: hypothetical protein WCH65_00435 [bacterium]
MKKLLIFVAIATVVFSSCNPSFKNFKEIVEKSPLDSSFIKNFETSASYDFYLPEYRIKVFNDCGVPFESKERISIYTISITGQLMYEFCFNADKDYKHNKEILNLLLAKKDKQSLPKKDESKFILY